MNLIESARGLFRPTAKALAEVQQFSSKDAVHFLLTIPRIDCLQITDIVTDPDDEEHVLGYRRLTAQDKILYYADSRCDDDDLQLLSEQSDPASKSSIGDRYESNCRVYHAAFDTLLK